MGFTQKQLESVQWLRRAKAEVLKIEAAIAKQRLEEDPGDLMALILDQARAVAKKQVEAEAVAKAIPASPRRA